MYHFCKNIGINGIVKACRSKKLLDRSGYNLPSKHNADLASIDGNMDREGHVSFSFVMSCCCLSCIALVKCTQSLAENVIDASCVCTDCKAARHSLCVPIGKFLVPKVFLLSRGCLSYHRHARSWHRVSKNQFANEPCCYAYNGCHEHIKAILHEGPRPQ